MDIESSKFSLPKFYLKIFGRLFIIIFKYGSGVCHVMSGYGILKYFHPILDKKVPPEDKELYSIRLGHY